MKNIRNISPETIELFEGEGYENRVLSEIELVRRLEAHGNPIVWSADPSAYYVADDEGLFTIDTTGWTLFDLLDYLNY